LERDTVPAPGYFKSASSKRRGRATSPTRGAASRFVHFWHCWPPLLDHAAIADSTLEGDAALDDELARTATALEEAQKCVEVARSAQREVTIFNTFLEACTTSSWSRKKVVNRMASLLREAEYRGPDGKAEVVKEVMRRMDADKLFRLPAPGPRKVGYKGERQYSYAAACESAVEYLADVVVGAATMAEMARAARVLR
jgi:hypothetical protein